MLKELNKSEFDYYGKAVISGHVMGRILDIDW